MTTVVWRISEGRVGPVLPHDLWVFMALNFTARTGLETPESAKSELVDNYIITRASLVTQRLKHLPPMWETRVRSLGSEAPQEKEMVTHSSILAWRIPWTEEPGRLQSTGLQRVGHN